MRKLLTSKSYPILGCLIIAISITACSQPERTHTLVTRNTTWIADLAERPKDDPDRFCIETSLNTGLAVLDFTDAKYSDAEIQAALLKGAKSKYIREVRSRDYNSWRAYHSVSKLSEDHLISCLRESGNQVNTDASIARCFYMTEPAGAFWLYKSYGRTLPASITLVKQRYNDLDKGNELDTTGDHVFRMALAENVLSNRIEMFSRCLRAAR